MILLLKVLFNVLLILIVGNMNSISIQFDYAKKNTDSFSKNIVLYYTVGGLVGAILFVLIKCVNRIRIFLFSADCAVIVGGIIMASSSSSSATQMYVGRGLIGSGLATNVICSCLLLKKIWPNKSSLIASLGCTYQIGQIVSTVISGVSPSTPLPIFSPFFSFFFFFLFNVTY